MIKPGAISRFIEKRHKLSLVLLLAASLGFMLLWGASKSSHAFHVDEIWQYSFANSYGGGTQVINNSDLGKWLSPDVFRDYHTVQPGQEFSIGPIVQSAENDLHPPLSHILLNGVMSFFPNTFSIWFALSINIAAYLLTVWALYRLSVILFGREVLALVATAFWAFSLGAVHTVMYMRMYCLLTLFAVCLVLFSVQYMRHGGAKYLVGMFAATLLGGLTEYIFWIFGCFTTLAFMGLNYKRSLKSTVTYAAVSLLGFLTACVVFPPTITQFTNENSMSHQADEMFKIRDQLIYFLDPVHVLKRFLTFGSPSVFGISSPTMSFVLKLGILAVVVVIAVIGLLCLLYTFRRRRSEDAADAGDVYAMKSDMIAHGRRAAALALALLKDAGAALGGWVKNNPMVIFIALPVVLTTYALSVVFPNFGIWSVRAFFYVFPFYSLAFAAVVFWLWRRIGRGHTWLMAAVVLLLFAQAHAFNRSPFLMRGEYEKLESKVKDTNVIVALESEASYLRLPNFSPALAQASNVYVLLLNKPTCLQEMMKAIQSAPAGSRLMVLNTLGVWPDNATAVAFLGPELLLTTNATFQKALRDDGFSIKVVKRLGHIFQWFNLYEIKPNSAAVALAS